MSYVFLCACEACLAYMNVDMYVAAYMMQQACKLLAGKGLLLLLWKKVATAVFRQVPKSVSVLSNAATYFWSYGNNNNITTCSATNVSAWQTMKGAAKCNKHCELHLSAHQKDLRMYASLLDTIASYCASRFICISCSFTLYGVCTMCTSRQTGTDLLAHSC